MIFKLKTHFIIFQSATFTEPKLHSLDESDGCKVKRDSTRLLQHVASLFHLVEMPQRRIISALKESEPQQESPQKLSASMPPLLPPEINLLIAKSLAPKDQLHLGLACKYLLFLTAPTLLGDSIMRQPRRRSTRSGIFCDAYHAGFVNLDLYDYLLERRSPRSFEFDILCKIAGRRGDIVKLEAWSRRCGTPISAEAAEGAAEAGNIAVLAWALERTPSLADWEATRILCGAARYRREDVLDFLYTRLDQMPQQLLGIVRIVIDARLIDLALRLYRQLPLCCGERYFIGAADDIADCSIETEDWQAVLAQFLETPSFISDAIGWNVFELAASRNRVDVMRYVDGFCDIANYRNYDSALGYAIAYGNTEAFDYICQTRLDWMSFVDDAIDRMPSSSVNTKLTRVSPSSDASWRISKNGLLRSH
jgi:hypothetical protein